MEDNNADTTAAQAAGTSPTNILDTYDANGRNVNGLTAEEQAEYHDYYTLHKQYHPELPIQRTDRTFGMVQEENPFLSNETNDGWTEDMLLGTLNMPCEYNHTVLHGTLLSRTEQQKLYSSQPTQSIVALTSLGKEALKRLKRETGHLLGCDQEDLMEIFLKRVLQGSVVPIIEGTVKRLPVRGEFMLHINEDGRLSLAWMKMSMHKLHRFLDLLIHDIKGSAEITFVTPQKEATLLAIEFVEQLKRFNIGELASDSQILTRVMAEARYHFSDVNMRLNVYISDPVNSQTVVFGVFQYLKTTTVPETERLRNEKIIRLFETMKIIDPQFPTIPNELGYIGFLQECEIMIEQLVKAFKAQILFAQPALTKALTMSEEELHKKLSHICPIQNPKPQGGGVRSNQPAQAGGSGKVTFNPQGNNPKATFSGGGSNPFTSDGTRGRKRDYKGSQKTSSTGATDNSAGTPKKDPVPCKACGGLHSAKSHDAFGTAFSCPYIREGHPQVNKGTCEFIDSDNGKQYAIHPWEYTDRLTNSTTAQYRLKYGEVLTDGKYVKIPTGQPGAARPREGENPVSFIAQLQDTHNPYNPFMTIIVLPPSNNRAEDDPIGALEDQRRTQTKGEKGRV